MSKLFFLLSLFVVVAVSQGLQCVSFTCVPSGGNCTSVGATFPACVHNTYCNVNNTCAPTLALGSACNSNDQCTNYDIDETLCWDNTCQAINYNVVANQVCTGLNQCGANLFCNNSNICVPYATEGQDCHKTECNAASICNMGTCVPYFSVKAGGACHQGFTSIGASVICEAGAYCAYVNLTSSICVTLNITSSNAPCNATTVCPHAEETCTCVNGALKCQAPKVLSQSEANKLVTYANCLQSKNCDPSTGKCCQSEACVFYDLEFANFDSKSKDAILDCAPFNPFDKCDRILGLTKTEIIIIVCVVVGVVLIAAVTAYFVRRRHHHHHYSEI